MGKPLNQRSFILVMCPDVGRVVGCLDWSGQTRSKLDGPGYYRWKGLLARVLYFLGKPSSEIRTHKPWKSGT